MTDKIRPEVIGALHYIREAVKGGDIDPILKGALVLMDQTGVFAEIDAAEEASPSRSGRHRRSLGTGGALPAETGTLHQVSAPSFADTHPRAARELGELIANLTQVKAAAPATVRFDVDLAYSCYQSEGIWTEAKTSQDTLYAEDEEKALEIAGERLLRKMRRAGSVTHADHLKIISGTTRAGQNA